MEELLYSNKKYHEVSILLILLHFPENSVAWVLHILATILVLNMVLRCSSHECERTEIFLGDSFLLCVLLQQFTVALIRHFVQPYLLGAADGLSAALSLRRSFKAAFMCATLICGAHIICVIWAPVGFKVPRSTMWISCFCTGMMGLLSNCFHEVVQLWKEKIE